MTIIPSAQKIGYVVKRYPRFSETFIVNEILAHEAAGVPIEIFSLLPPTDSHFQDVIARVRAPVHYLPGEGSKVASFWGTLAQAAGELPDFWSQLGKAQGEEVRDLAQAIALARHVRHRGIHHLHAHFASGPTAVARRAAMFAGVTYSFTAHAKDIFHRDVATEDLTVKFRDALCAVTVSDFNLRYLRDIATDKLVRIYNGIDLLRFPYTPPVKRAPRIVGVGRLVEKKGFSDLISACALLKNRGCIFECEIIGTGDQEPLLRAHIDQLGLQQNVALCGPRPQAEVISHLQSASALAAPCLVGEDGNRDGLPTVLLEAMALGTPCVSTDVTGIPEVVRHNQTGLIVGQRSPAELAEALHRLLTNATERVRLAAEARRLIETEFDIHENARRIRSLWQPAKTS
jgi:colanic acid/amylovoran biosynthesis glycosyltransferase